MKNAQMVDSEAAMLEQVLGDHRPKPGEPANILRTLLGIERVLGRVPTEAIGRIAEALGVPDAHVAGVLSYYPELHVPSRSRRVVRLCLGEACVANRSLDLITVLRDVLGVGIGETTPDGGTTLERVYCLGNCGVGPTVMVDDSIYGRVSPSDLRDIIQTKSA